MVILEFEVFVRETSLTAGFFFSKSGFNIKI